MDTGSRRGGAYAATLSPQDSGSSSHPTANFPRSPSPLGFTQFLTKPSKWFSRSASASKAQNISGADPPRPSMSSARKHKISHPTDPRPILETYNTNGASKCVPDPFFFITPILFSFPLNKLPFIFVHLYLFFCFHASFWNFKSRPYGLFSDQFLTSHPGHRCPLRFHQLPAPPRYLRATPIRPLATSAPSPARDGQGRPMTSTKSRLLVSPRSRPHSKTRSLNIVTEATVTPVV